MNDEIKLLKNNFDRTDSDLEKLDEFYRFLTGEEMPESISLGKGHKPKMSEKKAYSIIWYLQEHLSVFNDNIDRCNNCGELYDTHVEGIHWETKGKSYCGACDYLVPQNYDTGRGSKKRSSNKK